MDNTIIGSQITKFRKAAAFTQEELGRAVGVSTQAVSRWENGGAPDVTLLPAIADKLGVTIDALFGRECGEALDLHALVHKWIRSVPQGQVFDQLNRLLWTGVTALPGEYMNALIPFPETCYQMNMNGKYNDILTRSCFQLDDGMYFGVGGKDFSFTTLCPRPEEGYDAYLPDKDQLRRFLAILALPGCLEVLEYMYHQNERYYSTALLADGIGMEVEAVSGILQKLTTTGLVLCMDVELLEGTTKVYSASGPNGCALLMFQYLARCMADTDVMYYVNLSFRENPLL